MPITLINELTTSVMDFPLHVWLMHSVMCPWLWGENTVPGDLHRGGPWDYCELQSSRRCDSARAAALMGILDLVRTHIPGTRLVFRMRSMESRANWETTFSWDDTEIIGQVGCASNAHVQKDWISGSERRIWGCSINTLGWLQNECSEYSSRH